MPTGKRYHHTSEFGPGERRPLDRNQLAAFKWLVENLRTSHKITPYGAVVAQILRCCLGADGRCDPSLETIAERAGCAVRTVQRCLDDLKRCRVVRWTRRIFRVGSTVAQDTNQYTLSVLTAPENRPSAAGGHFGRGSTKQGFFSFLPTVTEARKLLRKWRTRPKESLVDPTWEGQIRERDRQLAELRADEKAKLAAEMQRAKAAPGPLLDLFAQAARRAEMLGVAG